MTSGDPDPSDPEGESFDELTQELYTELRRVAAHWMRGERPGHTLQATALANEAFIKLDRIERKWKNRGHYLATASRAMSQILIDHAHARNAAKRKATGERLALSDDRLIVGLDDQAVDILDMAAVLEELAEKDEAMRNFVELRFFGGCTMKECSEVVDIPERTLERRWQMIRAWLFTRLKELGEG